MFRSTRGVLVTIALGVSVASAAWAGPDWDLLASRRVVPTGETGVIEIPRREGRFSAIRFEVRDGALEIYDLRVFFANADPYSPSIRLTVAEGEPSRIIELPGQARLIERIVFRYRTKPRSGSFEVRVLGRQAQDGPGRGEPVQPPESGDDWIHLGAEQVDFRSDRDTFNVTGQRRFNAIMIAVEGADIEIHSVRVNFANGEHFDPDVRLIFEQNSRSRFIDLPGLARDIRNIEFRYRTLQQSSDSKAIVHVYGRTREPAR